MRRQLGQLRPSGTSAEVLFNPTENKPYTIDTITVANVTAATVIVSIYHDRDGTTYDDDTIIFGPYTMAVGETVDREFIRGLSDYLASGNVAVKTSVVDSVNFTAYGEIEGEKLA